VISFLLYLPTTTMISSINSIGLGIVSPYCVWYALEFKVLLVGLLGLRCDINPKFISGEFCGFCSTSI